MSERTPETTPPEQTLVIPDEPAVGAAPDGGAASKAEAVPEATDVHAVTDTDEATDAPEGEGKSPFVVERENPASTGGTKPPTGFLSPFGWIGLILFVVGLIVIGIAVGMTQGGSTDEAPESVGSLGPVSGLPVSEVVGANAVIGEVTLSETGAAFAEPGGPTIARVDAGAYAMLDSEPGWAQVVLVGPNEKGLYVTGWVQVGDGVTLSLG